MSANLVAAGHPCRGPDLELDVVVQGASGGLGVVGGSGGRQLVTLRLTATEYAARESDRGARGIVQQTSDDGGVVSADCTPQVAAMELPEDFNDVIVLGEPFLRRYYSVFDWSGEFPRVGVGLARTPSEEEQRDAALAAEADAIAFHLAAQAADMVVETAAAAVAEAARLAASQQHGSLLEMLLSARTLAHLLSIQLVMVMFLALPSAIRLAASREKGGIPMGDIIGRAFITAVEEPPPATECSICLGSCEEDGEAAYNDPKCHRWSQLRCGHQFHEGCILEWFKRAAKCPICRAQSWK